MYLRCLLENCFKLIICSAFSSVYAACFIESGMMRTFILPLFVVGSAMIHNCISIEFNTYDLDFDFIFVSSSLPIPWLLYGIVFQAPVEVNSCGMVCSIAILFMMLLFVIASIACFQWRMNKGLGVTMFLLYFVFVAISLMFEYKHLTCPF